MQNPTSATPQKNLDQIIKIDEGQIQHHLLREMVRSTMEETLNAMLDAETDHHTQRCERTEGRTDQRAGHYRRKSHTKTGRVELEVPRVRRATFGGAIIGRYRRRESSVEEALMEMYVGGASVRRVEDITQALWGLRVNAGTVSDLKPLTRVTTTKKRAEDPLHYPGHSQTPVLVFIERTNRPRRRQINRGDPDAARP